ncbi:hypothetical protein [Nocardiopsis sp. NRRL B-16309]|uniref:hypothetical protein n=1 Tax=Nocardiopsis sp. NRRL B-16309 TaxID=1519494 RepID=UPI000B240D52|nr:hypothetical protein [Nocardiopsis sp. NRRL B-16309]
MKNASRVAGRVRPETLSWVGLGLVGGGILLVAVDLVRLRLLNNGVLLDGGEPAGLQP